jgi:hypothetical protein
MSRRKRSKDVQTKNETREIAAPHPLADRALGDVARGYLEVPCKGGPESMFISIEIPVDEALERGDRVYGPDMRSILVGVIQKRIGYGE